MSLGVDWAWGPDWCVRSVVAMAWIGALARFVPAGSGHFWIRFLTALAVVATVPWRWHGGMAGDGWGLWQGGNPGWVTGGMMLWSVGAAVICLRRLAGWLRVRSWCQGIEDSVEAGRWREAWTWAGGVAGIRGSLPMRVVPGLRSPAVWVGRGTCLLVPENATDWSPERCRRVCLHEAGHVRGGDAWLHRIWMLVDVVQWWNPVWWWLRSRMELELEKLADAWVVAEGRGSAREYARDLVDSVEPGMLGLPSWGGCGRLEERVDALLRAKGPGAVAGGMVAMTLAAISVVVLAVVFRGPATSAPDATAARDAEWRMAANPFPAE